jgi:D-alanyl-D-alanine carboxypeptidase/D-alanyl-D-alanine-endopeptidase (penicillin-binding protein 4)
MNILRFFSSSKKFLPIFLLFLTGTALYSHELEGLFAHTETMQKSQIGIYVIDLHTKEEIFSYNGNKWFVPASLQKISTSFAALSLLGKKFRFTTQLGYEGEISQNILYGNVWIQGGGDPSLTLDILSLWEKALHKKNIYSVQGSIYVNTSFFETAGAIPSWKWEDLGNYYGAAPSALTINNNSYTITFQPGKKETDPSHVFSIDPSIPGLIYQNEVTTGAPNSGDQVWIFGSEYSPKQFYRGTIPSNKPFFTVKGSISNPPLFAGKLLEKKVHATLGVKVVRNSSQEKPFHIIHSHHSENLENLIQNMNLYSINLTAEHLLKTMGKGSASSGKKAISTFLQNMGVSAIIEDGSGLSQSNLFTPKDFASLLYVIRHSPVYSTLYNSLPEMGKTGTLQNQSSLKKAIVKAKTGSMKHIYNLAGYMQLPSGKEYAFVIFCNQFLGEKREIQKEMYIFLEKLEKLK